MNLTEQIEAVAIGLANASDAGTSATLSSNLELLVATAGVLGQDPASIDLNDAIRVVASNLAACVDEEKSQHHRANLTFLVELSEALRSAGADTQSSASAPLDEGLLTTTQAAGALGISRATLMRLLESGELEHVMVGSHHRIPADSLRSYRQTRLVSREDVVKSPTAAATADARNYRRTVQFGEEDTLR